MFKQLLIITGFVCLAVSSIALHEVEATEARSDLFFKGGLSAYFKGDYKDAIVEFQKSLEEAPEMVRSYYFLGYSYYKQGDMTKALEFFNDAYNLDPQYTPVQNASGETEPGL